MSTTMLSSSSSGRRKVASTTKVAPCSFCAGPKTSPEKLCAIMMWSRTVTLNKSSLHWVVDEVTEGRKATVRKPRQHLGQLAEIRPARDQRLEGGIAQQVERERQPLRIAPAAP